MTGGLVLLSKSQSPFPPAARPTQSRRWCGCAASDRPQSCDEAASTRSTFGSICPSQLFERRAGRATRANTTRK